MGSPKKRIQYRFDAVGNRVGMTDPDGGRFTYAYDAVNRITQVINPQGDRTSYAYDAGGRRTVKKLANGTRASFLYDAASNLTRLANLKSDGTTISSFNYEYDRVGNRTAVLESDGSRVTWSYDDTYQLTGEHRTGSHAYEDSYSYDAAGNRLLKIHDGARTTYSYDAANQLEWSENASGRTTYTFDADGNQQRVVEPTGDRTTTSWDYENRTTLVELPSGIRNTMAYSPGGLRMKLEESTGTKKFVWDGQNYLAETDENDDTQVVYTNEPRMYGNLVSQRRGTDSHWYHFDVIGSTRELTDDSETVTDTRLYDAWGVVMNETGSTATPFEYVARVGYFRHSQIASVYVRARLYHSDTGRWTSSDLLFPLYVRMPFQYSQNRPLVVLDPSGLEPVAPPGVGSVEDEDCHPPVGFVFREGRGTFYQATLTPASTRERLESDAWLSWLPNPWPSYVRRSDGCCCCDRIGFIQVATVESQTSGGVTSLVHDYQLSHYCEVDSLNDALTYPAYQKAGPCGRGPLLATMSDTPGQNITSNWWSGYTDAIAMSFQTCAVCISGIEGIQYQESLEFPVAEQTIRRTRSVTGLTVYGCISWGHIYIRAINAQLYFMDGHFQLRPFPARGAGESEGNVATAPGYLGEDASECFKRAVRGWRHTS